MAAKLITIFVEHPIIFIGYSLEDKNIQSILKSITKCLGKEQIGKLEENLIFVKRAKGGTPNISKETLVFDSVHIPITVVESDDFSPIYEALGETKRKIPAHILRFCKEQLYEIARSTQPNEKIFAANIEDIQNYDEVEFVVGLGIAQSKASEFSYSSATAVALFKNMLLEDVNIDSKRVLEETIPALNSVTFLPVFKYLKDLGIASNEECNMKYKVSEHTSLEVSRYQTPSYLKQFNNTEHTKSIQQIIETNPAHKAAIFIAFISKENFDAEVVKKFLIANIDNFDNCSHKSYSTYFRKLACLYDRYVYGWD